MFFRALSLPSYLYAEGLEDKLVEALVLKHVLARPDLHPEELAGALHDTRTVQHAPGQRARLNQPVKEYSEGLLRNTVWKRAPEITACLSLWAFQKKIQHNLLRTQEHLLEDRSKRRGVPLFLNFLGGPYRPLNPERGRRAFCWASKASD